MPWGLESGFALPWEGAGTASCVITTYSHCLSSSVISFQIYLFCVFCLHAGMCDECMPCVCRGWQRVPDALELELQVAVSCHTGAGNQIPALCKSNRCS